MTRALAGILLALAGLSAAAAPWGAPEPDRILLLGARTFGDDGHVVEALDGMLAASGVAGSSRFELIPGADVTGDDLLAILDAADPGGLRAIIAVVGDLSLMPAVDPNNTMPPPHGLRSSRRIDEGRVVAAMDRLASYAKRRQVHLVFATTPLGIQGRVETPELLGIAELVRARLPVLDLAAAFREREATPLFSDGIDSLDAFGQEAAAREIFHQICRDDTILPLRDNGERAARAAQRALDAWMAADEARFQEAAAEALRYKPISSVGAVRRAAVQAARDGLETSCEDWAAIEPSAGPCEIPGVSLARLLCRSGPPGRPSCDPVEAEILSISAEILKGQAQEAWEHGADLIASHPHRPETWVMREIIARATGRQVPGDSSEYPPSLDALSPAPISQARYIETLEREWGAAGSIPVMLVAQAPYAGLTPTGPILDALRRSYRLGLSGSGRNNWTRDSLRVLVPPAWHREAERLEAARDD